MRGRPFLVETKFDGWRIQLHVTGDGPGGAVHYFSRNVKDHGKRSHFCVLDAALAAFLQPASQAAAAKAGPAPGPAAPSPRVVLDGEMLVWNKTRGCFEPFGLLESTIKAAAEGLEPEAVVLARDVVPAAADADEADGRPLHPRAGELEVVYVAFDILYLNDTSVTHLPLRERKRLLAAVWRPLDAAKGGGGNSGGGGLLGGLPLGPRGAVTFRAEALLPERPMFDGKLHAWTCSTPQQAQEAYELNAAACEEGVVVKALEEPYVIGGRTTSWIKIKPDYLTYGEFDAVILGQLYDHCASGRVSVGGVYLFGLPEEPPRPGKPTTYVTFATVGCGLTREQRRLVLEPRLAGNLAPSPRGLAGGGAAARLAAVPAWCRATGARDEWPDWWVVDPDKSVVVQVNADVRLIRTTSFAAGYTTRFPRISRIRDDKGPRQATTLRELRELATRAAAIQPAATKAGREGSTGGPAAAGAVAAAGATGGRVPDANGLAAGGGLDHLRSSRRRAGSASRPRQARVPAVSRVPLHLLTADTSEVPVHYDLLGGAYLVLEGLYGADVGRRRAELSRLVRLVGGRVSANYVPNGDCRTSYVIVDTWVQSCHGGDARPRDLLRPDWLEDCYCQRRLIWPPKPAHAWRLSPGTLAEHADEIDPHGDPYFELLDDQDLAALLGRHVGGAAAAKPARQVLAAEAASRGQRDRLETHSCKTASSLPADTAAGLLHWLERELLQHGEAPPAGLHRLFAGAVLLLLDLSPRAASPKPAPEEAAINVAAAGRGGRGGGGALLLQGVREAGGLAARWAEEEARQQLQGLRLAVLRGGGRLVDDWSPAVTHVVLYDGVLGEEEEQEQAEERMDCGGAAERYPATATAASAAPPVLSGDSVLAALQSKCTLQQWSDASAELRVQVAASAAISDARGHNGCSPSSSSGGGCICSAFDADCEDDEDEVGEDGADDEQASRRGPTCRPPDPPQGAALQEGRGRLGRRCGGELARLLGWLGAACGAAHRVRGCGPAGGARVTDWRWIRDSMREAEAATAAAGGGATQGSRSSSNSSSNATAMRDDGGDPWVVTGNGVDGGKYGMDEGGDASDDDCSDDEEGGSPPDCGITARGFVPLPEALYPARLAPPRSPWCRPVAVVHTSADVKDGNTSPQTAPPPPNHVLGGAAPPPQAGFPPAAAPAPRQLATGAERGAEWEASPAPHRGPQGVAAVPSAGGTLRVSCGGREVAPAAVGCLQGGSISQAARTATATVVTATAAAPAKPRGLQLQGLDMILPGPQASSHDDEGGRQQAARSGRTGHACREGADIGPPAVSGAAAASAPGAALVGTPPACGLPDGACPKQQAPLPPGMKPCRQRSGTLAAILRRVLDSDSDGDDGAATAVAGGAGLDGSGTGNGATASSEPARTAHSGSPGPRRPTAAVADAAAPPTSTASNSQSLLPPPTPVSLKRPAVVEAPELGDAAPTGSNSSSGATALAAATTPLRHIDSQAPDACGVGCPRHADAAAASTRVTRPGPVSGPGLSGPGSGVRGAGTAWQQRCAVRAGYGSGWGGACEAHREAPSASDCRMLAPGWCVDGLEGGAGQQPPLRGGRCGVAGASVAADAPCAPACCCSSLSARSLASGPLDAPQHSQQQMEQPRQPRQREKLGLTPAAPQEPVGLRPDPPIQQGRELASAGSAAANGEGPVESRTRSHTPDGGVVVPPGRGSGGGGDCGGSSGGSGRKRGSQGGHRSGKRRRRSWLVVFEALTAGDDSDGGKNGGAATL